jgi:hypothetical protein
VDCDFPFGLKKECMEMVKFLALALALVGSLALVDAAEARGRRGCASCNVGGGCPGGVCYAPAAAYGPGKMAAVENAPPVVAESDVPPAAPAAVAAQPAPRSYANNARRGLFGRRR